MSPSRRLPLTPSEEYMNYLKNPDNTETEIRVYLNLDNLVDLREDASLFGLSPEKQMEQVKQDGFEGVQVTHHNELSFEKGLPWCGLNRINKPSDSEEVLRFHQNRGDACVTLHVGWGMESEKESLELCEAILNTSEKLDYPAFIETHRATITQDMWRTVELTKHFPELRFNGDFSHYYCGQEMVYGSISEKLDFLNPVFERVGFLHGRIAAPGYMQAVVDDATKRPRLSVGEVNYLEHFKEMWRRSISGFLKNAPKGSVLIFAPELLRAHYFYAKLSETSDGSLSEESDRYQQALLHKEIFQDCCREVMDRLK